MLCYCHYLPSELNPWTRRSDAHSHTHQYKIVVLYFLFIYFCNADKTFLDILRHISILECLCKSYIFHITTCISVKKNIAISVLSNKTLP